MRLLLSALEPSSNVHLKALLRHLPKNVTLTGIFDKRISTDTPLYDVSDMAIMGIIDALKKLPWFFRVADEMVETAANVDTVLLMDGSGFNLPLAKKIKRRYPDKRIVYYILPQVWASRPKRVQKLERYCDELLGILPFETSYYPSGKARYVGHPLLDEIEVTYSPQSETVAFLPGSRRAEITRLMPVFREVRRTLSDKRALLAIPPHFSQERIASLYGDISDFEILRDTHTALAQAEYAFICSGTATLEAALIGTPFTLVYIAKQLDYVIGTKLFGIEQVGLANILLSRYNGTLLHNELLQKNVTVDNLLAEYYDTDREKFAKQAEVLKRYLGHGSSETVAKILMRNEQ